MSSLCTEKWFSRNKDATINHFLDAKELTIYRLLDNTFNGTLLLSQLGSFLPLLIIGPLPEEIGWRGYAMGRHRCGGSINFRFNPWCGLGIMALAVVYNGRHFPA